MKTDQKYCLVTFKYTIVNPDKSGKKFSEEKTEKIIFTGSESELLRKIKQAEHSLTSGKEPIMLTVPHWIKNQFSHYVNLFKNSYYRLMKI